ncbi:MAG TPA: vWA domain-containing protein [Polyangiaceae bacterium]|nr:vWA domain-containing protein [Polyangiaceae bacterium]
MRLIGVLTLSTSITATLALAAGGCSSGADAPPRPPPASGSGGAGSNTSAVSNAATTNPASANAATGSGLTIGAVTTTTGGDACQELEVSFVPQVPTVFILVDRSTSMWDNMFWDPLRDGVLEVVSRLHEEVRLGFGTFTGHGNTCPLDLEDVGVIDKNNYAAIEAFYTPIVHPGVATETPTPAALMKAQEILKADFATFAGPKYILLVTDGNPDYCDSGATECRADTTVRILQDLKADPAVPIHTFVVALPDPGIDQQWLTAFANAGAGQPVSAPRDTTFCDDIPAASAPLFPGIDPTLWPQGTYGATMGPEEPYNVDPAQQEQLVEEISGVIQGAKNCIFDLTNAAGEEVISIVEGKEADGTVFLKTSANPDPGEPQPYDASGVNGWKVNRIEGAADQIELVGPACELLKNPDTVGIEFGFPCEIIIEVPK